MELQPLNLLKRDLLKAAISGMGKREARFLVDAYYMLQDTRVRANNQYIALEKTEEPHQIIKWLRDQNELLESNIKLALDKYTSTDDMGVWCKSITGIGSVISAGIISRIDIEKAPSAGHVWSYSGLVEGQERKRGEKINWDPGMKRICWLMGESFVKVKGKDSDVYGKLYEYRKSYENKRNESGELAPYAKKMLEKKKYGKDTEAFKAYSGGKLPPKHIHERSKRYAVKMFLSHYHAVAYWNKYGKVVIPYEIAHGNHVHAIMPPNMPEGMEKALRDVCPQMTVAEFISTKQL